MKVLFPLVAVGLGVLVSSTAHAADLDELLSPHHHTFESAQNFAFELRISRYTPGIDTDPKLHGSTPYADTFSNAARFLPGFEFDWQAVRIPYFGTLGLGVGASGTQMSAKARIRATGELSAESTTLDVVPLYAVGVLRADVLWREFKIPLVPYGKLGVGMGLWWASNSVNGISSIDSGGTHHLAEGKTFGYQAAVGMAFNLNCLDPITAKSLDNTTGVNSSYIYGELMEVGLTGWGDPKALRLTSFTWAAGLAFEF